MMEYTDRHFRHMVRLVSSQTLLYTEMVTANAIVHERREAIERNKCNVAKRGVSPPIPNSLLESQVQEDIQQFGYDMTYLRRFFGQGSIAKEGPSVLQLGGSDPLQLSEACDTLLQLTERNYCDYTAVNLNCGCPSPKVAGKGCFGAALMDEPELVRDCVIGMHNGCQGKMPITVKCRIGTDQSDMFADTSFTKTNYQNIDEEKEYSNLCKFIETVASSGVVTDFQIHARIAVLSKNFSPADNRKVPQLKYQYVRKLVDDYPEFTFSLNGGLNSIVDAKRELEMCENLKGVMIGRGWAANPWSFSMADDILYDGQSSHENKPKNRLEILEEYGKHADAEELLWDPVKIRRFIVKAATPLFAGEPNGKKYRIALDSIAGMPKKLLQQGKSLEGQLPLSELLMNAAMENIREDVLLRSPEETYERMYGNAKDTVHYGGAKVARADVTNFGSTTASSQSQSQSQQVIRDWQNERKEAEVVRDCQQIE
jgi:tRNA-dihydrouridine synthase A